jgi:uncharacterized protein
MIPEFFSKFNKDISWISDKTIYLVRHGSRAYGTDIESSDEDLRGVCIPIKQYYFGGLSKFEQAEMHEPDITIFGLGKFIRLASDSNPNAMEILFVDPADIIHINPLGEKLLANRELFLSKRVKHTMTGYAVAQLKRIKLHRAYLLNPPKKYPTRTELGLPEQTLIPQDQLLAATADIQKQIDKYQFDFLEGLDEPTKIGIRNAMTSMLAELKITSEDLWMSASRKIGLDDNFIRIMQLERQYTSAKREWDQYQNWKANRNVKRAALEEKYGFDLKHAYHLVRLIRMCREILTTGKVLVKRPDREELIAIRNGAWSYVKLIEFADREEQEINELYNSCDILPKYPDKNKLDQLCIELVETSLGMH